MDWRGRLETHAAWWTLLAGVPVFVLSALAIMGLGLFAAASVIRGDLLTAIWGATGALAGWRALVISVEALGQLRWWRLLHAIALWAIVAALYPGWWTGRG